MVGFVQIAGIVRVGIPANRLNFARNLVYPFLINKNTRKWLKHMM